MVDYSFINVVSAYTIRLLWADVSSHCQQYLDIYNFSMRYFQEKKWQIVSIVVAIVCLILALFPPVFEESREKFQRSTISSSLLEYGETGKILKKILAVYPIENQESEIAEHQNVREVIDRANKDRKKWLTTGPYITYRDSGIFCYFEMSSEQGRVPFIVSINDHGEWKKIESFSLKSGKRIYPFFLDSNKEKLSLDFYFRNKEKSVEIKSIVFMQPKFHPIVYYDPISYLKFVSNAKKSNYELNSNAIRILPSDLGTHYKVDLSFKNKGVEGISNYQKKQGRSRIEITTKEHQPLLNKLTLANKELQQKSIEGLPTLAIDIREEDLFSDQFGILKNYTGHGRDWERLAYVRYFRDGEQIFNTFTGLRLHGGDPGREQGLVNFRIYFRDEYGDSSIEQQTIFPHTKGEIKRLAVKQSQWEKWPLNSPISYELGDYLGALTPPTELVQLYLNGMVKGLYYLVPHLGENQIGLLFPDLNLKYFRYRGRQHDADYHFLQNDFWYLLGKAEIIDENFASKHFDLDNLIAQMVAIIFAGTRDFCQGVILKDDSPTGKLFWYMWDMDHSFLDIRSDIAGQKKVIERWEKSPSVKTFFKEEDNIGEDCPRSYLFRMLINVDPEFKYKAITRMITAINHQLTDDYLNGLLWKYWNKLDSIAYPYRQEYIEKLSDYFQQRKPFLFREIETFFPSLRLKPCEVISAQPFRIDGYLKTGGYSGYHVSGQPLHISVEEVHENAQIYVNNLPLEGHDFAFPVSENGECRFHLQIR